MSESLLGVRVAATRQNAGSSLYGLRAPADCCPGAKNCPDGTICADVIFASLNERLARLSHGAASSGVANRQTAAHTAHATAFRSNVWRRRGDLVIGISSSSDI